MYLVLSIILALWVIEAALYLFIRYFRKDFQWLITKQDERPLFDPKSLNTFLTNKYSPILGWTIKPGISSKESTGSLGASGGHEKQVTFHSNHLGGRVNPGNEELPPSVSCYGDSYAFCRQVEDEQSWQWHLSNRYKINMLNFGVGNFGIDQALIRLKNEYNTNPAKIVILEAVPETIVRILSVWKHYYEYGNILAFKPFFKFKEGKLLQFENPINSKDKFENIDYYLKDIKQHDIFYKTKFKKYQFNFPYTFSFVKHPIRNLKLFSGLIINKISKLFGRHYDGAWRVILNDNASYCKKMYRQEYPIRLLLAIIEDFVQFASEKGFKPILLILPFEEDIAYYRRNKKKYYDHFIKEASTIVQTVDLTERLAQHSENLYTNSFYGSHLNATGNRLVAKYLTETLDPLLQYPSEKSPK